MAAQPGHTKDLQTIQLERGIKIVDSPGVVFDDDDFDYDGKLKKKDTVLLRNVIKVEDIEDPIPVVEQVLSRTDHELLKKTYNLPRIEETLEFLAMVALTTGRLLKVVSNPSFLIGLTVITFRAAHLIFLLQPDRFSPTGTTKKSLICQPHPRLTYHRFHLPFAVIETASSLQVQRTLVKHK